MDGALEISRTPPPPPSRNGKTVTRAVHLPHPTEVWCQDLWRGIMYHRHSWRSVAFRPPLPPTEVSAGHSEQGRPHLPENAIRSVTHTHSQMPSARATFRTCSGPVQVRVLDQQYGEHGGVFICGLTAPSGFFHPPSRGGINLTAERSSDAPQSRRSFCVGALLRSAPIFSPDTCFLQPFRQLSESWK